MKKLLILLAMSASLSLHAQASEVSFEGDTTGKAQMNVKAIHELSEVETWIMHNLRSIERYGIIVNGLALKVSKNKCKFIVNYEEASLTVWVDRDDIVKKEEENSYKIVTTKWKKPPGL